MELLLTGVKQNGGQVIGLPILERLGEGGKKSR